MRKLKLLTISLTAAVAFALSCATASAYDMSFSPGGLISADSLFSLTFSDSGGLINVACPVTLTGSVDNGPIAMRPFNWFGDFWSSSTGSCSGGAATVLLTSPPWEFDRYLGTAPNGLTGLLFAAYGFSFEVTVTILRIPVRCLYRGSIGILMALSGSNPYTTSPLTALTLLGNSIPKSSGSAACPSSGRVSGSLLLFPAQTVTVF